MFLVLLQLPVRQGGADCHQLMPIPLMCDLVFKAECLIRSPVERPWSQGTNWQTTRPVLKVWSTLTLILLISSGLSTYFWVWTSSWRVWPLVSLSSFCLSGTSSAHQFWNHHIQPTSITSTNVIASWRAAVHLYSSTFCCCTSLNLEILSPSLWI